jgi:hypothetical protein
MSTSTPATYAALSITEITVNGGIPSAKGTRPDAPGKTFRVAIVGGESHEEESNSENWEHTFSQALASGNYTMSASVNTDPLGQSVAQPFDVP